MRFRKLKRFNLLLFSLVISIEFWKCNTEIDPKHGNVSIRDIMVEKGLLEVLGCLGMY
jgi:hypothetical protein